MVEPAADVVKNPLQSGWVWWFDNPKLKSDKESWEDNLKPVHGFDSVEDFWCLFNNMVAPKRLSIGSNYHVFKKGIKPMWEDPGNRAGGKWVLSIPKNRKNQVDQWWMYTILLLIGENLNDNDDISGAVVSVRKSQDRIALWTKSAQDERLQKKIGYSFRQELDLPRSVQLIYQAHADAEVSGSSFLQKKLYEA